MIRYTTPTIPLVIEGVDLTGADEIIASFRQMIGRSMSSNEVDIDGLTPVLDGKGNSVIEVPLSQMQTGRFRPGTIQVQVNYRFGDLRNATSIASFTAYENLLQRVVGNE